MSTIGGSTRQNGVVNISDFYTDCLQGILWLLSIHSASGNWSQIEEVIYETVSDVADPDTSENAAYATRRGATADPNTRENVSYGVTRRAVVSTLMK